MEAQLRDPLKALGPSQHYHVVGFKGVLNWSPIMPKEASLSDRGCKFFQSGHPQNAI